MLFALVGQVAWQFFQTAVSIGGMSLVNQQHLLTKIYFPRLFLPSGVVGGGLVDLLISLGLLAGFMVGYHFTHYHFTPPLHGDPVAAVDRPAADRVAGRRVPDCRP